MKKITPKMFVTFLEEREERFAIIINHWFYYVEKGRVYRFEQHNNQKVLAALSSFYDKQIDGQALMIEIQKSVIKQIQYDWFTDVWKETIIERVHRSAYELEAFFF
ncbi:hypothetical protein [Enterococcus sp. 5H]|uniref:hypothetical protein n=1 Tax=Enterococcus sp. 5H TaxID=1229490 RepID=UPI0023044F55|nr:hypothetical protein [Enterococcus sp. 5H]MDA9471975.1 hypothetical protein [Enterococcus sp. 5H]